MFNILNNFLNTNTSEDNLITKNTVKENDIDNDDNSSIENSINNEINVNTFDYDNIKYELFLIYNKSEYYKNCAPFFKNPKFSIKSMMYITFMRKYTTEKSAVKWMAAYKIQIWWRKLKNNKCLI